MNDQPDQRNYFAAERTLLAAERTLLAWNRTAISLMGFGFAIERTGMFFLKQIAGGQTMQSELSFWIGITFLLVGMISAFVSVFQYKSIIASMETEQIPKGYSVRYSFLANWFIVFLGLALTFLLCINFVRMHT
ncbi:MAG: DUF202 domain-containing protein [Desulfohalobiaceae bacterium]|nr:DUF202 domain-containing protein [Desulfohalobiaceae bacterium]